MLSDTASVSVLFSEPKIPQSVTLGDKLADVIQRFSALQRAENSSIGVPHNPARLPDAFQCSSASRKFLNRVTLIDAGCPTIPRFQCSSASRKFLNKLSSLYSRTPATRFSALQRAENSSIVRARTGARSKRGFSALQRAENSSILRFLM